MVTNMKRYSEQSKSKQMVIGTGSFIKVPQRPTFNTERITIMSSKTGPISKKINEEPLRYENIYDVSKADIYLEKVAEMTRARANNGDDRHILAILSDVIKCEGYAAMEYVLKSVDIDEIERFYESCINGSDRGKDVIRVEYDMCICQVKIQSHGI